MPIILDTLKSQHEANYPTSATTYHIALFNDARSSFTFGTANVSGNTITVSGNDFVNGTRIVFGGTPPAPLQTGTIGAMSDTGIQAITGSSYYVINASGSSFQVSATRGGSTITLTNTGSGTMTVSDVPLDASVSSVTEWVRKEVSSYQGATSRKTYTPSTATIDSANSRVTMVEQVVELDNTSGSASIIFDKALMIKNGSATRGNTTGTADSFYAFGSSQTVAVGENRAIRIPNILANG